MDASKSYTICGLPQDQTEFPPVCAVKNFEGSDTVVYQESPNPDLQQVLCSHLVSHATLTALSLLLFYAGQAEQQQQGGRQDEGVNPSSRCYFGSGNVGASSPHVALVF